MLPNLQRAPDEAARHLIGVRGFPAILADRLLQNAFSDKNLAKPIGLGLLRLGWSSGEGKIGDVSSDSDAEIQRSITSILDDDAALSLIALPVSRANGSDAAHTVSNMKTALTQVAMDLRGPELHTLQTGQPVLSLEEAIAEDDGLGPGYP